MKEIRNEAPQQKHDSATEDELTSPADRQTIQHPVLATIQMWSMFIICFSIGATIVAGLVVVPLRMFAPHHIDVWLII